MPSEMLEQLLSEGTIAKKLVDADILVVGHSHIPMDMVFKGIRILNPGSVGQPRDGDPRASYAILDTETWSFSIYRVKYDVEAVIRKLEGLNLEQKYLNRLKSILLLGRVV
jgi:protein phosphatase